jgi:hypothetical protein
MTSGFQEEKKNIQLKQPPRPAGGKSILNKKGGEFYKEKKLKKLKNLEK